MKCFKTTCLGLSWIFVFHFTVEAWQWRTSEHNRDPNNRIFTAKWIHHLAVGGSTNSTNGTCSQYITAQRRNASTTAIQEKDTSAGSLPSWLSSVEKNTTAPHPSLEYSIFQGKSGLRNLPGDDKKSWNECFEKLENALHDDVESKASILKARLTIDLIWEGYLDAAHDVLLGVTLKELEDAEYAATHRGQTNWTQDHPFSDFDDVLHSLIHRLEGPNVGEGGHTGYQNAKYWLAGGPKKLERLEPRNNLIQEVYQALVDYLRQAHPTLVDRLVYSHDTQYEIIAGGGKVRTVIVSANTFNGMALIELLEDVFTPEGAGSRSPRLLYQLQDLLIFELRLWKYFLLRLRDTGSN